MMRIGHLMTITFVLQNSILMTMSLYSFDLIFTAYKKALIQNLFAFKVFLPYFNLS